MCLLLSTTLFALLSRPFRERFGTAERVRDERVEMLNLHAARSTDQLRILSGTQQNERNFLLIDPSAADCDPHLTRNASSCEAIGWREGEFMAGVEGTFRVRCQVPCVGGVVGVPGHLIEVISHI